MSDATRIFTFAVTLSVLAGLTPIAHAQMATPPRGADALRGIHNQPSQSVFFGNSKIKPIIPSSPEERDTWTRDISKDWVIQTRTNRSPSGVFPQDNSRDNSDLRVLYQLDQPSR
jgi:hypothetical protein